ncbi:MAG TPA: RNA polymerase factor sigma-54 [Planctomycetota bacterium]|nr:RNA polymerase factor sigma-54 [Planctomycetota bacterium]
MAKFGLGTSMQQSLGQHMQLLPRMLQAIEVLQLSSQDLEAWVSDAVSDNEALTLDGPAERGFSSDGSAARTAGPRGTRADSDRYSAFLESQPGRGQSLAERLEENLAVLDLGPRAHGWLRLLLESLDENGWLAPSDEQLLAEASDRELEGGAAELARALERLRTLEPRGLGARGPLEAMLYQIDDDDPDRPLLARLLGEHLVDLSRNKLPAVARAIGVDVPELERLLERLRGLNPRPAAELSGDLSPVIEPDMAVERVGTRFEVTLSGQCTPVVSIDPSVETMAKDRASAPAVRRYLREKLERARSVVEALEMRRHTLGRIGARLFEHQRDFLEHGPGHLAPLRMKDLADELGIHVSTVSRAVAGKHAQTPWGILSLRHFFQGASGGEERAREDVRDLVRNVFASEDPAAPLSDDEVVISMRQRGFELARRTVAKYRQELDIPSSYRRRRYA